MIFADWDYEYDAQCLICHKEEKAYSKYYVCKDCAANAELGQTVRKMAEHPKPIELRVYRGKWTVIEDSMCDEEVHSYIMHENAEDYPETALKAAGLMEAKK